MKFSLYQWLYDSDCHVCCFVCGSFLLTLCVFNVYVNVYGLLTGDRTEHGRLHAGLDTLMSMFLPVRG